MNVADWSTWLHALGVIVAIGLSMWASWPVVSAAEPSLAILTIHADVVVYALAHPLRGLALLPWLGYSLWLTVGVVVWGPR